MISQWTEDQRTNTRKLIEAQLDAYDQGIVIGCQSDSRFGMDLLDGQD